MLNTNNPFLKEIERRFMSMKRYEDVHIQTVAAKHMPTDYLEMIAQEKLRKLQLAIIKGETDDINISIQEMILHELLSWFKNDFFSWVDNPDCKNCNSPTKFSHMSTDPKMLIDTDRVEMHRCTKCHEFTPFPRYTNLYKLLYTRKGRCGEWANVFTLFCRTLGWDARYVCDETDHVWTEVFSIAQKRWLHCDPCENKFDNPLMYEIGWGKSLSYIIAYSIDEIQDVTWRYSANHAKVLANRNKCSESELIQALFFLREHKQTKCSSARKNYLNKRIALELADFMTEQKPTDSAKQGRTSGSLDWRLDRGETKLVQENKIWKPTESELHANQMTIRYSSTLDFYEKILPNQSVIETVSKWENGAFAANKIFRKEERDWKVVYLCREETSTEAEIQWKFESQPKRIEQVTIKFNTTFFENGKIEVTLTSSNSSVILSDNILTTNAFKGSQSLILKARLTGGTGDCAWQHAQLFRESLSSKNYPFSITITFQG